MRSFVMAGKNDRRSKLSHAGADLLHFFNLHANKLTHALLIASVRNTVMNDVLMYLYTLHNTTHWGHQEQRRGSIILLYCIIDFVSFALPSESSILHTRAVTLCRFQQKVTHCRHHAHQTNHHLQFPLVPATAGDSPIFSWHEQRGGAQWQW